VVFVLVCGSASEMLGFHFVIGAFFGAVLIDQRFFLASRYSELEKTIGSVTGGFLAPIFFSYLGVEFDLSSLKSPLFVLTLIAVSAVSKILAGKLAGRLAGLSKSESLGIGIILNGRGVMGLVIASIAYERHFIEQDLFSALILMSLVTTILAPLLFRRLIPGRLPSPAPTVSA
jgi:Kef-type K+ transport system membrane component KefB